MFLGDSVITPAISVLSAVEGLKLATPAFEHYVRAAHRRHPDRAVRGAAARHRAGRGLLRPGHGGLVRRHRDRRRCCTSRDDPRVFAAINPLYAHQLPVDARPHRPGHARRGVPGGHRRRGALCRSRPFRPQADPDAPGSAWCCRRCCSTISARARWCWRDPAAIENPFYRLVPECAAAADGRAGDRRDRDREPGGHHRRLFADASGDPARPAAAPRDPAHLGGAFRPDLHAARQHRAAGRRAAAGRRCSAPRARSPRPTASR